MRIAIVGVGGVGGYLGARLAAAGEQVALIARGAHLAAISERGLRLESPLGDVIVRPTYAGDEPARIGEVDLVLFAVKLYDAGPAAAAARPLIGPHTAIVTFQNGVEAPGIVGGVLGREHVVGGVAQIAAVIAEPGLIRHTGIHPHFTFGELDGRRSERTAAFARALERAGVGHTVSEAIEVDLWRKMVFLATLSGVTALTRLPIGPLRSHPATRGLLRACLDEALAVGRARGVALPADGVDTALAFIDGLPATNRSSMLDDLARGRRLELPWLGGAIARMGRELGVVTPTHELIAAALAPFVDGPPRLTESG